MNHSRSVKSVGNFAVSIMLSAALGCSANADEFPPDAGFVVTGGGHHGGPRADGHAPIGVMGDHVHKKGEWMLSYRYMRMGMEGNRIGTRSVSADEIASTVPNMNPVTTPIGATVTPPPFLRVVPTRMTMDMHMFGAMYAVSDSLTLMAMVPVIRKEMDHITYQAPMGVPPDNTNRIGGFTTETEGIGDISLTGLYKLYDDGVHHVHLNMGLRAPTGSIEKTDRIFDPFGRTPRVRLPYSMQIGTGTWDLLPGLTYNGHLGDLSWGAQYRAELRLEDENDNGWAYGDKHMLAGWLAYQLAPWISASVRTAYTHQENIYGSDPLIGGPVQTAHPDFYGGEKLELFGGINTVVTEGALKGHRFALEVGAPIYQDLNGPQMETDWTIIGGWQYAF